MQIVLKNIKSTGRREDTDKRKQICGGQHAPTILFFRPMLQKGADGNDEEPAKKTKQREHGKNSRKGKVRQRQQETEDSNSRGAQRDEPVFDFSSGKI